MALDVDSVSRAARRLEGFVVRRIRHRLLSEPAIWGPPDRVHIEASARIVDATINTTSGHVYVGKDTFFGHGVTLITGTHNYELTGAERRDRYPREGRDIRIGSGVWIASNVTVLGPCHIGDDSVIAAGALVRTDVPPGAIAAGVPATIKGHISGRVTKLEYETDGSR